MKAKGRVIGLDLGSRRIGVAVSDDGQTLAVGVDTIERSGDRARDHDAVGSLVTQYEAVGLVVGLPLSLSGGDGPAAVASRAEAGEIAARVGVDVEMVDERLTTVAAASALRRSGRSSRRQRAVIDRTAAAVLLQTWLDARSRHSGAGA